MTPGAPNLYMFQFHNGTINTQNNQLAIGIILKFQFHNGTINTIQGTNTVFI